MTESKPKSERASETSKLISPTERELATASIESLDAKWKQNHERLLKRVEKAKYPFFALHGTSIESAKEIAEQKSRQKIDLATFREKRNDELFVYQLYLMMDYVSNYAVKRDQGQAGVVIIFASESEGENRAEPYEPLKFGGKLLFDSVSTDEHRMEIAKELEAEDQLPWRGDTYGTPEVKPIGAIKLSDFEKYLLACRGASGGITRSVLRRRFLAQELTGKTLDILAKPKKIK